MSYKNNNKKKRDKNIRMSLICDRQKKLLPQRNYA